MKAETKGVKVRYGKTGKVLMKQVKIKTPYLKGETLWRAIMDPYKPKLDPLEHRSKSLTPPRQIEFPEVASDKHKIKPETSILPERVQLPKLFSSESKMVTSSLTNDQKNQKFTLPAPKISKKEPTAGKQIPYPLTSVTKSLSFGQSHASRSVEHREAKRVCYIVT